MHHAATPTHHAGRHRRAAGLAVLLTGLLMLTGCGGGDEPEDIPKPDRGSLILQAPPAQALVPAASR